MKNVSFIIRHWSVVLAVILSACCLPPTAYSSTPVAADADLATVIEHFQPGQNYQCAPHSTYVVKRMVTWTAAKANLDLNGSHVSFSLPAGFATNIDLRGNEAQITNGFFINGNVTLRVHAAGVKINSCTFDDLLSNAIFVDTGGTSLSVDECYFGESIGSVPVYITASGAHFNHCSFHGSVREYEMRFELDSITGQKPQSGLIENCEFFALTNGKQLVGVREGDWITFRACIFHGPLRVGQGSSPTIGQDADGILFDGCIWPNVVTYPSAANPLPLLDVFSGSIVTVKGCSFAGNAGQVGIACDTNSTVSITGCTQIATPAGVKMRTMTTGKGKISEAGTKAK